MESNSLGLKNGEAAGLARYPSAERIGFARLTAMAFGGTDLRTLYITTARHNRPATEMQQYPLSGCVLALQVDVPGRVEPAYIP